MPTGNAETGSTDPYDASAGESASPYDETTGRIPVQRRPSSDRDAFYDKHSRRMTRVDELDDLDPDDVETRRFPSTPNPPAASSSQPAAPQPAAPSSSSAGTVGDTGHRRRLRPAPQRVEGSGVAGDQQARTTPQRVVEPGAPVASERHDTAIIETGRGDAVDDGDVGTSSATPSAALVDGPSSATAGETTAGETTAGETTADDQHATGVAQAPRVRRGTLDLGLLLLRVAVGAVVMAHGLSHLFGWWNGTGLDGFQNELLNTSNPAIGFAADAAKPLAAGIALAETIGGLMVIVGLLTPIGASAILAVMLLAAAFKTTTSGGLEFFASANGVEFELMMAAAAAALVLTGPGLYSLDYPRGWARRPFVGSVLWLVIGVAVACVIWIFCNGTDPFSSPGNPR
ncbi:DoxX family protein [Gordonia otitidis]|uniref:DoxX family protein n=1 Tax=Gordonia otitidis (strain DSM 44809 / CCUG 52243 / JCM 12355 / NBRC 100426 / IFM 10032) TaxID=1108044 RepID=H5TPP4_GORO1|nr:hypothetical protein GOOTI_162_00430 [Gordonia otitidis NBRC 100426]